MIRSKTFFFCLLGSCFLNFSILYTQPTIPTYSIIQLELDQKSDIRILNDLGIAADHVHWHGGHQAELFVSDKELKTLNENGFEYVYVVNDTKEQADKLASRRKQNNYKSQDCGLKEYSLGKIAGYHEYEAVMNRLDSIVKYYPDITRKEILGTSHQGRNIVALKISDNVAQDESSEEGTAYYDALTHAREPLSMMSSLFYIEWLLENYDNPETIAKYLVDNREMHFVLIVNPDGYAYNTNNFPNGGGGWRKNRRTVNDTCIGVDLNRNFNAKYDGPGSHSNDPCSNIYRGKSANSEVETQFIQEYIDRIKPATAFSSHSYSNVMIDPSNVSSPEAYPDYDFDVYSKYASEFTPEHYHGYGPSEFLIGYEASGTTLAYLYEAGAIAWTPEIGTKFWEPREKICDCVQDMLEPMRFISKVAGPSPVYHHHYLPDDSFIVNGETIELYVGIKNKGLQDSNRTYTATLSSSSSAVGIVKPDFKFTPAEDHIVLYNETSPFVIDILDVEEDLPIEFEFRIYDGETLVDYSTFEFIPGSQKIIFEEDFEDGLDNWIQSNTPKKWSLYETDAKSGKYALVDSKQFHNDFARSSIGLKDPINLENAIRPFLFFNLKHSFSPQLASASLFMSETSSVTDLRNGNVIRKDYTGHSYWKQEVIDLTYASQNFGPLYMKFLVEVAGSRVTDGLYIDGIKIVDLGLDNTTSTSTAQLFPLQINAFPNPTSNSLTISTETAGGFSLVELFNNVGQKLISVNYTKGTRKAMIDLSNEPAGSYFLKTHSEQGINMKKIVKL